MLLRLCLPTPPGLSRATLPAWLPQLASPLMPLPGSPGSCLPVTASLPNAPRVQNASHSCRPSGCPLLLTPGLLAVCRPHSHAPQSTRLPAHVDTGSLESRITALLSRAAHALNVSSREGWGGSAWPGAGRHEAGAGSGGMAGGLWTNISERGLARHSALRDAVSPPVSGCLATSLQRDPSPPPSHLSIHPSVLPSIQPCVHNPSPASTEGSSRSSVMRPHDTSVGSSL